MLYEELLTLWGHQKITELHCPPGETASESEQAVIEESRSPDVDFDSAEDHYDVGGKLRGGDVPLSKSKENDNSDDENTFDDITTSRGTEEFHTLMITMTTTAKMVMFQGVQSMTLPL